MLVSERKKLFFLIFLIFFFSFFPPFVVNLSLLVKVLCNFSRSRLLSRDCMASDPAQVNPHVSMRNGCRCVLQPGVSEEDARGGGRIDRFHHRFSSRMNKAIEVFLKTEQLLNQLTERDLYQ